MECLKTSNEECFWDFDYETTFEAVTDPESQHLGKHWALFQKRADTVVQFKITNKNEEQIGVSGDFAELILSKMNWATVSAPFWNNLQCLSSAAILSQLLPQKSSHNQSLKNATHFEFWDSP